MENSVVEVRGPMLRDFQVYLENRIEEPRSPYSEVDIKVATEVGMGKTAGTVEIVLLTVGIAQDLLKDLFKDYLKDLLKRKQHSLKYKIKNNNGEELEITLNGLKMEEVEAKVNEFTGRITEIISE